MSAPFCGRLLLAAVFSSALLGEVSAQSLAINPIFDQYSQVAGGQFDVAQPTSRHSAPSANSRFYFSAMEFDVSSFAVGGTFTLELSAYGYASFATTGSSTLQLVALNRSYRDTSSTEDFFDRVGGADRRAWFDTYVSGETAVGSLSFTNLSTATLDVSAVVNEWLTGARPNYGFALYTMSSEIYTHAADSPSVALRPTLTQVPEPGAAGLVVLSGMAWLSQARRRREVKSVQ